MIVSALLALPLALAPSRDDGAMPAILSLRDRAQVMDRLVKKRLDVVVPEVMRRTGVDMWVLISREYNEDPVLETMLPATWFAARRRTILLFYDRGPEEGVERLAVSRYSVGDLFPAAWVPEEEPDQWKRLAELIVERDPKRLAVNMSPNYGHADGLTATEQRALLRALPATYREKLTFEENLAVGWLETRIPEEMDLYGTLCKIAHRIIAEGFSTQAIEIGKTTTADLEWWYRERIAELKLHTWFHPSVSLQRNEPEERSRSFAVEEEARTIERGDLLHVDFGIEYLDLNTDTQQHAYVLREGEEEAPEELRRALGVGNRLQDILTSQFETGRTGNQMLLGAIEQAKSEGIDPRIYTHPLGYHGHAAGPTIGMWDQQEGVPGSGDYPLFPNTVFSIELNAAVTLESWGDKRVLIMLEEDAFFDGKKVRYIDGRQTELILIR